MKSKHLEIPCRGGQNYVSPALNVVDIEVEGVLCASGDGEGTLDINDWLPDEDPLNW